MKKTTFSILFYGKKNGLKANGKKPVMGRITVNGKSIQFGTKVDVDPKLWNRQVSLSEKHRKATYQKYKVTKKHLSKLLVVLCISLKNTIWKLTRKHIIQTKQISLKMSVMVRVIYFVTESNIFT